MQPRHGGKRSFTESLFTDQECANSFLFINSCFDTISFAKIHKRFCLIFKNKLGNLECCHRRFLGSSLSLGLFQAYFRLGCPVKLFKLLVPAASWTFHLAPLSLASPSSQSVSHRFFVLPDLVQKPQQSLGAVWALAPSTGLTKDPNSRLLNHSPTELHVSWAGM